MKNMSVIGMEIQYKTQGGDMAYGRVVAEYERYVVLDTEFGYRTCIHKADLMKEEKDR